VGFPREVLAPVRNDDILRDMRHGRTMHATSYRWRVRKRFRLFGTIVDKSAYYSFSWRRCWCCSTV